MIAADHLAFLMNLPLSEICRSGELLAMGMLKAVEQYEPDFIIVFSDVYLEAEALGVELNYPNGHNPHPLKHLNLSQITYKNIANCGRMPELFHTANRLKCELGDEITVFFSLKDPFSLAALATGIDRFLALLVTDPEAVHSVLKLVTLIQTELIDAIIEKGYIPFIGAPMASGGMIGDKHFRKFAEPYIAKLFDSIRICALPCCLHICGEVNLLLDRISVLKPDVFSIEDETAIKDWYKLPDTIPMGYMPTELLMKRSKDDILQSAQSCIDNMTRPCIFSTGCDLPAKSNPDMVKIMMETWRNV